MTNAIWLALFFLMSFGAHAEAHSAPTSEDLLKQMANVSQRSFDISVLDHCGNPECHLDSLQGIECVTQALPPKTIRLIYDAMMPILPDAIQWMARIQATRPPASIAKIEVRVRTDGSWTVVAVVKTPAYFAFHIPGIGCNGRPIESSFGGTSRSTFITDSWLGFQGEWAERFMLRLHQLTCRAEREKSGTLNFTTPGCP